MKTTKDLCKPCAAKLAKDRRVSIIAEPRDYKCVCQECGRRRFGAVYSVGRRKEP